MRALIPIVIILAIAGAGFYAGHSSASKTCEADKRDALQRLLEQTDQLNAENSAIVEDWNQQQQQQRTVVQTVEKEVIRYVTQKQSQHSDCNITVGAECLLNAARLNLVPADECPGLDAATGRAASAVTTQGLITADIECADKYNRLQQRHKALITLIHNYQQRTDSIRGSHE